MNSLDIPIDISSATLHLHLSYEQFFASYDPYRDGQVYIATYSFEHRHFAFWSRLRPLSAIFVAPRYREAALGFLKRFPLFEVREIPGLHTKAVFFVDSGRLLLGSENLYAPTSAFSELMIELTVPPPKREEIVQRVFRDLTGQILTPRHGVADIRLHANSRLRGLPFLPCHKEIDFWDLVANVVTFTKNGVRWPEREHSFPTYIHNILEYEVDGTLHHLAFDRGYAYCGDLEPAAYRWLVDNCTITETHDTPWSSVHDLSETSPLKDFFMKYHPIANRVRAQKSVFLGPVKEPEKHQSIFQNAPIHDITDSKIRRPKEPTSDTDP